MMLGLRIAAADVLNMTTDQLSQRVLVVEDDPAIRRLIELCLDQPDRTVDLRGNGAAGLEAIAEIAPDVVVLDITLPDIDGWEVLRALRLALSDDVAVVIVTADTEAGARARAETEGANAFMTKPFRPNELRKIVDLIAPR